jgi:hypothetical protein
MIHRDRRRGYESASSFGQIIHREGPAETSCGDVDLYLDTRFGNSSLFRVIERFQQSSPMKPRQYHALSILDQSLRHAARCPLFGGTPLLAGSGVSIVRGEIRGSTQGHKAVEFGGPQVITNIKGDVIFEPSCRDELWSWLIGNDRWTIRQYRDLNRIPRRPVSEKARLEMTKQVVAQRDPPFSAITSLLPRLAAQEMFELRRLLSTELRA